MDPRHRFFVAYFTEDELLSLHVWAGYAVGVVIGLRVIWGVIGPRRARFSDFVYRPGKVLVYLRALLSFSSRRYLGHSPAGGAMVLALLLFTGLTVFTGLYTYAIEENAGPLKGWVQTPISAPAGITAALADDDHDERNDEAEEHAGPEAEFWEEAHEVLANFTLILVLLHIAGVLLASLAHRENLVWAMIDGRKRADKDGRTSEKH